VGGRSSITSSPSWRRHTVAFLHSLLHPVKIDCSQVSSLLFRWYTDQQDVCSCTLYLFVQDSIFVSRDIRVFRIGCPTLLIM
jgi:hypothetical protein